MGRKAEGEASQWRSHDMMRLLCFFCIYDSGSISLSIPSKCITNLIARFTNSKVRRRDPTKDPRNVKGNASPWMFPDPIKVTIPANANHSTKNDAIQIAIATISGTSTLAVSFHHTFIDLVILLKPNLCIYVSMTQSPWRFFHEHFFDISPNDVVTQLLGCCSNSEQLEIASRWRITKFFKHHLTKWNYGKIPNPP